MTEPEPASPRDASPHDAKPNWTPEHGPRPPREARRRPFPPHVENALAFGSLREPARPFPDRLTAHDLERLRPSFELMRIALLTQSAPPWMRLFSLIGLHRPLHEWLKPRVARLAKRGGEANNKES